jgi:hypothetical protein
MAIEKTIVLKADTSQATKDIKKLDDGVKGVDKSSKGAKGGLGKMSGATKMLGTAFKALGIGLIIAAFMKLKDIFSGNIETARKFEKLMAQTSAAFDVIRDRAEEFIKSLIKLQNPFKAFKEAFKGTTAEIKEEVKAVGGLTEALQGVRDEEREMLLVRAKANNIIAKSRLLAEDETKSAQERLVALKEAVAEEKRVADLEIAIQQKKTDALQGIIDLGKSSEEDMQNLASERARLIELQTGSILKQKRVVTEIVAFEKEIETARVKEAKSKLDRDNALLAARELNLVIDEELTTKEIEALIKTEEKKLTIEQKAANDLKILKQKEADEIIKIADKKAADELKATEDKIAMNKAMEISGAQNILGALGQLAGEGTKLAKATAVSSILINTAQGVSAAIKAGAGLPFPANLGAIATGVGAVLSGIASAKSILKKVPEGGDAPDTNIEPDIGSTDTPSLQEINTGGLGGLIPNMNTIQPVSTAPIQAFVVENDISNAQALQEELEIQATL